MKEKSSPFKSSSMKSGLNPSTTKLSSSTSSQRKMNGFSTTEDDSRDSGHGQICCLVDDSQRCTRPAGNACYSKRIAKTVQQRKLKLTIDHSVRHIYICDFHKSMIQSVRSTKKRKKGSDEDGGISPDHDLDVPEVDLFHLQVNTLRRYKRHYKIQTKPGLNKAQLADIVARHFRTIPVREKEALTYFIYMVKNNKSRFDQKHEHS
ncbi:histone deacetylase complex subunit SAP30L [Strongylocentrotus purpuratus]|uniref:Histone deacetylase complex subunit SAP30L n=1 Tax=Strongylocentrotus purpuratus TaxID=7668 RepID=A0A7M7NKK3_STRPU|nr:histone deacetylase complex subunit SAP30L [Strongylocentrotus purpuratus]|eukprot:XP_788851.3 PREDICTED: histone deacetylase complex subunit SAP30L [Strongylocentrotus purpuratus]